jgi:hypothetical protein
MDFQHHPRLPPAAATVAGDASGAAAVAPDDWSAARGSSHMSQMASTATFSAKVQTAQVQCMNRLDWPRAQLRLCHDHGTSTTAADLSRLFHWLREHLERPFQRIYRCRAQRTAKGSDPSRWCFRS